MYNRFVSDIPWRITIYLEGKKLYFKIYPVGFEANVFEKRLLRSLKTSSPLKYISQRLEFLFR